MTLPFILNVALVVATCLAFYKILLRRETFYSINRYLLIVCLGVSFALPLLRVPQQFSLHGSASSQQATGNGRLANAQADKHEISNQAAPQQQLSTGNKQQASGSQQPANDKQK